MYTNVQIIDWRIFFMNFKLIVLDNFLRTNQLNQVLEQNFCSEFHTDRNRSGMWIAYPLHLAGRPMQL